MKPLEFEPLLTPAEVSRLFKVETKQVTKWADKGLISSLRTIGGHRRYLESEIHALLAASRTERRDG